MMSRRALFALPALAALWPLSRWLHPDPLPDVPVLPVPEGALRVFHLGHSLVGPDMPHMLAQLAPQGHGWNSQLGSGTSLKQHWEPELAILDFEITNQPPAYRDAREAIGSGDYDAVVLTEMVELHDAIRYFDGADYFQRWADLARAGSPKTRIFLYETWHHLNDPEGWEARIHGDLEVLWLQKLSGADSRSNPDRPVYLIPAGQVMAAVAGAAEAGKIDGLSSREDLFARNSDGDLDTIHINDLGAYVVALTHYSVLYQRNPLGLPHRLTRADGSTAQHLSEQAAIEVQQIVWQTLLAQPRTGLAAAAQATLAGTRGSGS
ncbi:hypothetical protein [Pseudophaeobacter sp.]|uniref:hypothetical protein n=1 Tax=Pseudophaeobacter sp. TaxID=1971739 RepID=UPI003298C148